MKRGLLLEEMTVRQEVNYTKLLSSPARGTWVEITDARGRNILGICRLPHGGRGLKSILSGVRSRNGKSSPARGTWVEMSYRR